jgi:hypothetical protein
MVTGVAISPLLGVGAVGAYEWWKASGPRRTALPWYARPYFWVPALALVALAGLKDIFGTAAPTVLKKPFDVAETVENKVSGLIAAGLFVPLIISIFPENPGEGALAPSQLGFAAISGANVGNALLVPFALVAFFLVFFASHAINVLILLSPFTTVDTALKSVRLAVLSLLTGVSFANAYVGAAVGVVIVAVSYFLAGWSFRLTVFGTVYIWDYATFRRCRFQPGAESNWGFAARKIRDVPVRTYGRLAAARDGGLEFSYRPWLFLGKRTLPLPSGNYIVGRGLFCPELALVEGERTNSLFIFPPRYLTHEESLARVYGLGEVQDVGVLKGLRASWGWIKSLLGVTPTRPVLSQIPQPSAS